VEYALLLPSALGDHSITVFNLTRIDLVDLFAGVLLADPSRRALLESRSQSRWQDVICNGRALSRRDDALRRQNTAIYVVSAGDFRMELEFFP